MSSSCSALLGALKTCLLESDCVQKHGRLPSECLKHHTNELPEACQNLRKATYECKRNMVRRSSEIVRKSQSPLLAGHAEKAPGQYGGHGRGEDGELGQDHISDQLWYTLTEEISNLSDT
ncbi:cytochrome c oxidase assembly protein [Chiua virens]|nr:cytochrome c oxidase assembly protein [Chiua virens]